MTLKKTKNKMKTERSLKEDFMKDFEIASDLTPAIVLNALRQLRREEAQAEHEMKIDSIHSKLDDQIADIKKAEAQKYLEAHEKSNIAAQKLELQSIAEVNQEMDELEAEFKARKAAYQNAAADIQYILNEDGALTPGEKSRLEDAKTELEATIADAETTKEDFHEMIEDNYDMPEIPVDKILQLITEYVNVRGEKFPVLFREEAKVGELLEKEEDAYSSSIAAEGKAKKAFEMLESAVKVKVAKMIEDEAPQAEIDAVKKQLEKDKKERETGHQMFLKSSKEFRRNLQQLKAAVSRAKEAVIEVRAHLTSLEKEITEAVKRAEFADFKEDGQEIQATAMEVYDKMADVWSEAGLPDNPFEGAEYVQWREVHTSLATAQESSKDEFIETDKEISDAFVSDKDAAMALHSLEREKEVVVKSIADKSQAIVDTNAKLADADKGIIELTEAVAKANEKVASIIAEIEATEQSDFEIGGSKAEWEEGQVPSAEDIKAAYDKYFDEKTKESNQLTEDISEDNSQKAFLIDQKSELEGNIADMETEKTEHEERVSELDGSEEGSIADAEVKKKEADAKIQELSNIASKRAEKATELVEAEKAEKDAVAIVTKSASLFEDLALFTVEPFKKVVKLEAKEGMVHPPLSLEPGYAGVKQS
jgi:chromosome segregation ATPase